MHTITKDYSFVYGHRLWNQTAPPCSCRRLHGHNGILRLSLTADLLTDGMILDFNRLSGFKHYLDTTFDHRFFIDQNDPLLPHLLSPHGSIHQFVSHNGFLRCTQKFKESYIQELFDSFIIVPFIPTAEELSKFFYQQVNRWLWEHHLPVCCTSCGLFETPTAMATFS